MKTITDIELGCLDLDLSYETPTPRHLAEEGALILDFVEYVADLEGTRTQLEAALLRLLQFAHLTGYDFEASLEKARSMFKRRQAHVR